MIRSNRLIMVIFFTFIITGIIVGITTDKTKSATADEKLEIDIINAMEDTKKEQVHLFKLMEIIPKELHNKGFGESNVSFSHMDRVFTVQAKDMTIIEKNKDEIEKLILGAAKKYDIQNIKVEFQSLEDFELSEEDKKKQEELSKIANIVSEVLKENGYGRTSFMISENDIKIELINGDLANVDQIEELIADEIFLKMSKIFTASIKAKSKNKILDQEWQPVFSSITDEVPKKFEEYRGFAYSFHPKPLEIIVKTNLNKSKWFWNTDKTVKQIVTYTDKVIELKTTELSIEKVPYEIIIYDKKGKRMN